MKRDKAAAAAKSSPEWRSCGGQEQPRMEIMKGDKWSETRRQPRAAQNGDHEGSSPEWRSWRETNNEGRQGGSGSQEQNGDREGRQRKRDKAAAPAKSSPEWSEGGSPEWRSWRETNEGRQMKKGDFGNQHAGRQMKGDNWRGGDFGNQHAGRQRKGDKWRGGDFGNQHAGGQMKEDKWRREILEISMQGDKWRETNEEGRLGAAAISVISRQGDKWRETNEEGRLGAAAISVVSNPTFEK